MNWNLTQLSDYRDNAQFRSDLLRRYVSPEFMAQYRQTVAATPVRGRTVPRRPSAFDAALFGERWQTMRPDQQTFVIQLLFFSSVILLLVLAAEFLPFKLHPKDPHRIRAGLRSYRVEWATGKLSDYRTRKESESTSEWLNTDPYGTRPTQRVGKWMTSTISYLYEDFSLVSPDNEQNLTVVQSAPGSISEGRGYFRDKVGREISAVWVKGRKDKLLGFLLFYDSDVDSELAADQGKKTVTKLRSRKIWTFIPAMILGFAYGMTLLVPLARIWVPIVALIAWRTVFNMIRISRERRFLARAKPRLLKALRA